MVERREIPCTDCDDQRRVIEMGGDKFISCDRIPSKPGMCELVFELVFRPAAAAPATAKKKKATTKRKKAAATKRKPAATRKKAAKAKKKSAKKARK